MKNINIIFAEDLGKSYLSHFGILGQKCGKKNGPPYPLNYGDYTEEQKKLNKGLTDTQKNFY